MSKLESYNNVKLTIIYKGVFDSYTKQTTCYRRKPATSDKPTNDKPTADEERDERGREGETRDVSPERGSGRLGFRRQNSGNFGSPSVLAKTK